MRIRVPLKSLLLLLPGAAIAAPTLQFAPSTESIMRVAVPPEPQLSEQPLVLPAPLATPAPKVTPPIESRTAASPLVLGTDNLHAPVLAHIASTGARIEDLGPSHGLESVMARTGDQFMLLQVTPDGEAAIAGLQAELPVARLLDLAKGHVTDLGISHGLRGFLLHNGPEFQVLYVTPDGERVIPGVMWDASGKNITREQVAPLAGMIPTVEVGPEGASSAPSAEPRQQAAASPLGAIQDTVFGTYGDATAPRLWMFIDPQCPFSIRAMQQLQPLVEAKKVQLAIVPLALIDYENQGRSTQSALAMLSTPLDDMVAAWRADHLDGPPGPLASENLKHNMALAETVGVRGTPTFLWRKGDGTEGRADGLPPDLDGIVASIEARP